MYFYVDESGHTGPNLFDKEQPMLYYGVLSSKINADAVSEPLLKVMRQSLGVERLPAAELGNAGIVQILPQLLKIQRQLDFKLDVYRVAKPDHAVICFFDQVFGSGTNEAMTWTGYWTPLRYILLFKVAYLFDMDLAKDAWEARISTDTNVATALLRKVCRTLIERLDMLPDVRSRELIGDVLSWAINHPEEISFNVSSNKERLSVTPNIIGFQCVMHGIAARIKRAKKAATKIVVDQQLQFNKAQKTLADFYLSASSVDWVTGLGLPKMELKDMPQVPLTFSSGKASAGLELVDINLWVFKRFMENKQLAPELGALIKAQLNRGRTDEISLKGLKNRWTPYFKNMPELHEMSEEQIERGRVIRDMDETRRLAAVAANQKAIR